MTTLNVGEPVCSVACSPGRFKGVEALVAPIAPQLELLSLHLANQVSAFEGPVRPLLAESLAHLGKRLRSVLLFFAGFNSQHSSEQTDGLVRAAAVLELIHLATLIHDDILDKAEMRHNTDTVDRKYGTHVAVLLGDAIFAHALKLASDFPTVEVCRAASEATRQVCSGEIAQTFARGQMNMDFDQYRHLIDLKTAELFAVAARLGALLGGGSPDFVEACERFGRQVGIAYQMFDDWTDVQGQESRIGKTLGTDWATGKCTLPFILLRAKVTQALWDAWMQQSSSIEDWQQRFAQEGIAAAVKACFDAELAQGLQAIAPYQGKESVKFLMAFAEFIEFQWSRV
ncbi:MAG: hypothetical protein B7X06_00755 [Verrucomicrobia bacterium 21-51-4]|nr:MAG: hypothetical protein B7X06_00755 [Verrucomicrobia bacterium 21-51-4]HQU08403.1 polyprenyl synthetase family protein [Opitutales bacterium]